MKNFIFLVATVVYIFLLYRESEKIMTPDKEFEAVKVELKALEDTLVYQKLQHPIVFAAAEQGFIDVTADMIVDDKSKDGVKTVDPWGNPYQIRYPGKKREGHADLFSYGKDGKKETKDDIGNWSDMKLVSRAYMRENYLFIAITIPYVVILVTVSILTSKKKKAEALAAVNAVDEASEANNKQE